MEREDAAVVALAMLAARSGFDMEGDEWKWWDAHYVSGELAFDPCKFEIEYAIAAWPGRGHLEWYRCGHEVIGVMPYITAPRIVYRATVAEAEMLQFATL